MAEQEGYEYVGTFEWPGLKANVCRPVLDDATRRMRRKEQHEAAAALLKDVQRRQKLSKQNERKS